MPDANDAQQTCAHMASNITNSPDPALVRLLPADTSELVCLVGSPEASSTVDRADRRVETGAAFALALTSFLPFSFGFLSFVFDSVICFSIRLARNEEYLQSGEYIDCAHARVVTSERLCSFARPFVRSCANAGEWIHTRMVVLGSGSSEGGGGRRSEVRAGRSSEMGAGMSTEMHT
jgi:hypothetical protein